MKAIAVAAGLVFFFDNKITGTEGKVLLGSIAVLLLCLLAWVFFGLGDDDENTGYWPRLPRP